MVAESVQARRDLSRRESGTIGEQDAHEGALRMRAG
jgi:hypothetical protein